MDKETRAQLEAPFPRELHRTRRGSHGKELKYVEVARYVQRLNEAAGGDWSFEILEHKVLEQEVVVLGRLSFGTVSKSAFGGSSITVSRDTGKALSLADDLKAASADALKKCASLLGVGLDLYSDVEDEPDFGQERKQGRENVRPLRPKEPPASKPSPAAQSGSSTDGKLTIRQSTAIRKLGEQLGMTGPECLTWILKTKGVPLDRLTTRAASQLISELQSQLTGRPGRSAAGGAT